MIRLGAFIWISSFSYAAAGDIMKVSVSIAPQMYFVKKIGGDMVDVSVLLQPGANPAFYEPRPRQMVLLTKSRIYFAIGVPFEEVWLKKFAGINPKMIMVHTEDGIEKIPMKAHHLNHDKKKRRHGGIKDPHVWLSPPLVMIQARNILDALLKIDPTNSKGYQTNYKAFIMELVELDLNIRNMFMDSGDEAKFMVYHPSWGYFARAYGLEQIPIEMEGKEPTPKELRDLINHAKELNIKIIFVQPQFSAKSAKTIAAAAGCQTMFADPLELNWAKNLLKIAEKFKSALR